MIDRRWLSLKEAAEYLAIHYTTAYRMAIKGELPAVPITNRRNGHEIWRVDKKKLDELLEAKLNEKNSVK